MNPQEILAVCSVFIALLGLYSKFFINPERISMKVKFIFVILVILVSMVFLYTLSLILFNNTSESSFGSSREVQTTIRDENLPPSIAEFALNTSNPIKAGETILWSVSGSDPDEDTIQYKFVLDNDPMTNWLESNSWPWTPLNSDIGSHVIEVRARDGKHNLEGDARKTMGFVIESLSDISADTGTSSASIGYTRTNEYTENGVEPLCEPGSKQAICSSPDSCVDCNGKCWPEGSYNSDSGIMTCSEGKWTLVGYPRTNEYSENSLPPNCTPGSKQAICSSPCSCVDCNGECWLPGSYNSGMLKCSQGKWTIIGYPRVNEYAPNGTAPICAPGSKRAICSSPDSCVDCNGKCWPPGSYNTDSGTMICSQGKWTLT